MILVYILMGYIVIVAIVVLMQRYFMYFPFGNDRADIQYAAGMDVASVTTDDGLQQQAWYSPAQDGQKTLVVFHGNAHNIAFLYIPRFSQDQTSPV